MVVVVAIVVLGWVWWWLLGRGDKGMTWHQITYSYKWTICLHQGRYYLPFPPPPPPTPRGNNTCFLTLKPPTTMNLRTCMYFPVPSMAVFDRTNIYIYWPSDGRKFYTPADRKHCMSYLWGVSSSLWKVNKVSKAFQSLDCNRNRYDIYMYQ